MIILREKHPLDEMAIRVISSRSDGLPFKITIQSPETDHLNMPHAHIRDRETGKKKLGAFQIPKSMPRRPEDIKDFAEGVSDEWRELIFRWMKSKYKKYPRLTNWEALYLDWLGNVEN
jgi:hypothetical protein